MNRDADFAMICGSASCFIICLFDILFYLHYVDCDVQSGDDENGYKDEEEKDSNKTTYPRANR
jgi:hypothetical protein